MATAKKKPAAKKAPSRAKTTVRKTAPKHQPSRSFKSAAAETPFFTFKATTQTVYWLILCGLVLALGIWVLYLNMKVQKIYDQIDLNNALNSQMELQTPAKKKM